MIKISSREEQKKKKKGTSPILILPVSLKDTVGNSVTSGRARHRRRYFEFKSSDVNYVQRIVPTNSSDYPLKGTGT